MPNPFRVFNVFRASKRNTHLMLSSRSFAAKRTVLSLLVSVLCVGVAIASGFSKTYSLSAGTVTVTNNQKRSSWAPAALLFHFTEPVDPAVSIKRLSDGTEFLLSSVTLTNVQDVTWIPEADYPFNYGDSLIVTATATNGTLELIQRSQ